MLSKKKVQLETNFQADIYGAVLLSLRMSIVSLSDCSPVMHSRTGERHNVAEWCDKFYLQLKILKSNRFFLNDFRK